MINNIGNHIAFKYVSSSLQYILFGQIQIQILHTNSKYKYKGGCAISTESPPYQGWLDKVYVVQNLHWIADKKSENFFVQISMDAQEAGRPVNHTV